MMPDYAQHFNLMRGTFISPILGYFNFEFNSNNNLKVIVMSSVFNSIPKVIHRKYDMKGSKFNRKVLK